MNKEKLSMGLMGLSVLATVLAGYVFLSGQTVFNIAGTQWILVAIALGIYGMYAVNCPCNCGGESCCSKSEEK